MLPVSVFDSRIWPYVLGCPEPLLRQAVVDAAIALCDRSLVLIEELDPQDVRAGVAAYDLDFPPQQDLAQITRVWVDSKRLTPIPADVADDTEAIAGEPTYYFTRLQDESIQLRVYPVPDKDVTGGLRVQVALKPKRNATQLNALLFNHWADAVVFGALGTLLNMPNQSFSNPALGVVFMRMASAEMTKARTDSAKHRTRTSASIAMRPFA